MVNRIREHEAGVRAWRRTHAERNRERERNHELEVEYGPLIERHDRVKHYLLARAKRGDPSN